MTHTNDEYQSSNSFIPVDFSKIKVGTKFLTDANLKLGDYSKINPRLARKS
jgi:hypothetical protein